MRVFAFLLVLLPGVAFGAPGGPSYTPGAPTAAQVGAVQSGLFIDLRAYLNASGAQPCQGADDTLSFTKAAAAMAASGAANITLSIPGRCILNSTLSLSIPANATWNIVGYGPNSSEMLWQSDVNGISVSLGGLNTWMRSGTSSGSSLNVYGVSFVRDNVSTTNRTALYVSSTTPGAGNLSVTQRDVVYRGTNSGGAWGIGFSFFQLGQTTTDNVYFHGASGGYSGVAGVIASTVGASLVSTDHQFKTLRCYSVATCLSIGPNIQGITVQGGTEIGINGIVWTESGGGDYLAVDDVNFACTVACVQTTGVQDVKIGVGNYFISNATSGTWTGISATETHLVTISGVTMQGLHKAAIEYPVYISNTTATDVLAPVAVVSGNGFYYFNGNAVTLSPAGESAAISGTPTTGDVVTLSVTSSGINSGTAVNILYTVQSGDTLASIAVGLAAAANAISTLATAHVSAVASGAVVNLSYNTTGLMPPFIAAPTWTQSVSGSATEIVTFAALAATTGVTVVNNKINSMASIGVDYAAPGSNLWDMNFPGAGVSDNLSISYMDGAGNLILRGSPAKGVSVSNALLPSLDQSYTLGSSGYRWGAIFGSAATLNTLTTVGAINRQGMSTVTPSSGNVVALGATVSDERILGSSTLSSLTVKLPGSPANGQEVKTSTQVAITSLVVQDSAGAASDVITSPSSVAAGGAFACQWNTSAAQWWCRVGS